MLESLLGPGMIFVRVKVKAQDYINETSKEIDMLKYLKLKG